MTEAKNRRSDTVWTSEANTPYPSLKRELKQAGSFDRVPWSKLRTARKITRAFCRKHDIPYGEMTFTAAVREIFQQFDAMANAKVAAG